MLVCKSRPARHGRFTVGSHLAVIAEPNNLAPVMMRLLAPSIVFAALHVLFLGVVIVLVIYS